MLIWKGDFIGICVIIKGGKWILDEMEMFLSYFFWFMIMDIVWILEL